MKKLFEKILLEDVEEKLTSIHIDNQIEPKSSVIHNFNKLEIPELTDSISEYTHGSKQINRNLWGFKNKNNTIDYNEVTRRLDAERKRSIRFIEELGEENG